MKVLEFNTKNYNIMDFILVMIIFTGCSQKQDILVTKKVYPDISKNAVFDAAKTLFTLSNKENGNKSFIVDAYRDKLEINKIMFEDNIIKVDIVLDKWILELYQVENETRANLIIIRRDGLNRDEIEYIDENAYIMENKVTGEDGIFCKFYEEDEMIELLQKELNLRDFQSMKIDYENIQNSVKVNNSDIVIWGKIN